MSTILEGSPQTKAKRPTFVWVISIFYFLSAGWVLLSFALIHSGAIPLKEAQKQYFQSQTILDFGLSLLIGVSNFAGAILLFFLRKSAFYLFATAFGIGLALTVYQIFTKNWLGAIGGPGLVGAVIGWGINIAIIIYSKCLIGRGVLR